MGFAKHAFEELGDAWSPLLRRLSASCSQSQKTIRSCAIEGVQQLQEQFVSTENRSAYARQFYNDEVMKYNTVQTTFPRNLFAAGFSPTAMFAPADAERTNVQVKL